MFQDDRPKTPPKDEKNPQSENADDSNLYDRDEDMYNQDAELPEVEENRRERQG